MKNDAGPLDGTATPFLYDCALENSEVKITLIGPDQGTVARYRYTGVH